MRFVCSCVLALMVASKNVIWAPGLWYLFVWWLLDLLLKLSIVKFFQDSLEMVWGELNIGNAFFISAFFICLLFDPAYSLKATSSRPSRLLFLWMFLILHSPFLHELSWIRVELRLCRSTIAPTYSHRLPCVLVSYIRRVTSWCLLLLKLLLPIEVMIKEATRKKRHLLILLWIREIEGAWDYALHKCVCVVQESHLPVVVEKRARWLV